MKVEEAIFCEKSYMGETNCTDCKYYGTDTCESRESHRMAIEALEQEPSRNIEEINEIIKAICKVAHIDDISDLSDGYHTFRQLYYQRMMLFAVIVKQNRDRAWKSLRHEDGELCFGGGWFIVGIDTPKGSYTYHYEDNYFSLFDCVELERGKAWDGHTEKDVTRLLSLEQEPSCEDVIRREDALQALCKAVHKNDDNIPCPNQRVSCLWSKTKVQDYAREIWKVPPASSKPTKPKTAHWVYKIYGGFHEQGNWYCSHCNYQFNYGNGHAKFCPECGYEMSEPPEEISEYDKRRDQPY